MKALKQRYSLEDALTKWQLLVSENNFDAPPEYNAYGIKTSSEELILNEGKVKILWIILSIFSSRVTIFEDIYVKKFIDSMENIEFDK